MTAKEAVEKASQSLKEYGIENPSSDLISSQAMLIMMEELIRVISSSDTFEKRVINVLSSCRNRDTMKSIIRRSS